MGEFPTKEEFFSALAGKHGSELQKRISSSSVAICGLGGLGSNIAAILVRSGIGMLRLIDFDRVDLSNIGRQQYFMTQTGMYKTDALAENLRTISTYTEIHTYTERISEENASRLIGNCEIVCEAFDRAEEKAMLVNHVLEKMQIYSSSVRYGRNFISKYRNHAQSFKPPLHMRRRRKRYIGIRNCFSVSRNDLCSTSGPYGFADYCRSVRCINTGKKER